MIPLGRMDKKVNNMNGSGVTNNNTFNDHRTVNYYPNVVSNHDPGLEERIKFLEKENVRIHQFQSELRKTVINLSSTQKTNHKDKMFSSGEKTNLKDTESSHANRNESLVAKTKKLEETLTQLHNERDSWYKERLELVTKIEHLEETLLQKKQSQSQDNESETPTVLSIIEDTLLEYKPELNIYKAHQLLMQPHQSKEDFTKKIIEDSDGRLVVSKDGKCILKRKNEEVDDQKNDKVDDNQNNGNKRQKHVR